MNSTFPILLRCCAEIKAIFVKVPNEQSKLEYIQKTVEVESFSERIFI
jgi:hypothetical protein